MQTDGPQPDVRRRNVILALVHAALALAILAAFVYVRSHQ